MNINDPHWVEGWDSVNKTAVTYECDNLGEAIVAAWKDIDYYEEVQIQDEKGNIVLDAETLFNVFGMIIEVLPVKTNLRRTTTIFH